MLFLYYFNWAGTSEELREFAGRMKTIIGGTEGVEFSGLFIPTSEWHYVIVWDVTTYEKALQIYKAYSEKYGPLRISLGKLELLHTLEEIPFL